MEISRRDFMKIGAKGLLGGVVVYSLPPLLKGLDRKSTRLNSSHIPLSRMPSSA